MNEYNIHTKNISSSLVFYRALFNQMPVEIAINRVQFRTPMLRLVIHEQEEPMASLQDLHYPVAQKKLGEVYGRMRRFMGRQQFMESCQEIETSIGLIDPDGNRWIIGDAEQPVEFENCYYN